MLSETILTFAEAAAHLPRLRGRKLHASTIWRWARKGINGVRLETRRVGGRFVTSAEALERFTARLADIEPTRTRKLGPSKERRRTRRQRDKAVEQAERELKAAGI